MNTRITIGGSRTYDDYTFFKNNVDAILYKLEIKTEIVIVSGHCKGVDMLAERYAKENNYTIELYKAEWNKYGKSAGPIRNEIMVNNCDYVIAFWDGESKGTKNLIQLANKYNKYLTIVHIKNRP